MNSDVDECQTLDENKISMSCGQHGTCINTIGSFVCSCKEGFLWNANQCEGNVCFSHHFIFLHCFNSAEIGYQNLCKFFFHEDVDECLSSDPCYKIAGNKCINTQGAYYCECQSAGFSRSSNWSMCIGWRFFSFLRLHLCKLLYYSWTFRHRWVRDAWPLRRTKDL